MYIVSHRCASDDVETMATAVVSPDDDEGKTECVAYED